jgi:hypothetical protein
MLSIGVSRHDTYGIGLMLMDICIPRLERRTLSFVDIVMKHCTERFLVQPVEYFTVRFARSVIHNDNALESAGSKIVHIPDQFIFGLV